MGWIKVAEQLLNPFGDDDEDFHINYLIDRYSSPAFGMGLGKLRIVQKIQGFSWIFNKQFKIFRGME